MNWKLRLKNKTTLVTLCVAVVGSVYGILAALGIVPSVTQDNVMDLIYSLITILCALGIVVDPTTAGIKDSEQAMTYETPRKDG